MNEIKLTFTIDETNLLLEALGELPFVRVHQIINKIQSQAAPQLQDTNKDVELNSNND